LYKLCKALLYLIPYAAEFAHDKLFRTLSIRRVIESDVQALANLSDERWTGLIGTTASGNHIVPR
jgi:hypothetical protein